MEKIFLTHAEQLEYLVEAKGLTVTDRDRALDMLCRFGYFSLVDGYKAPFKEPDGDKYRNGTTFDDIVALFKMDENLRELFFKYIMRVELQLRSLLAYYFTEKYGHLQEILQVPCFFPSFYRRNEGIGQCVKNITKGYI